MADIAAMAPILSRSLSLPLPRPSVEPACPVAAHAAPSAGALSAAKPVMASPNCIPVPPTQPMPPAPALPAPTIALPTWPRPTARMPDVHAQLVAAMLPLFDPEHAPNAPIRLRQALPAMLLHFFPWTMKETDDQDGLPFYVAQCVLLFALQKCKARLDAPYAHAFIDDFCAALSVSRKITHLLETQEDVGAVAKHGVLRFLSQGSLVLCPAGANQGHEGHAMMTLFLPQQDGTTLCAVLNRGAGVELWHHCQNGKPQPFVVLLSTDALLGEAGAAALQNLLACQVPTQDRDNTVEAYYAALGQMVEACDGIYLLSGSPQADILPMPGQSRQKPNNCTIANTFAAMNFVLAVQLRCFQDPPSCSPDAAHAMYRRIKQAARAVILQEAIDAYHQADTYGEDNGRSNENAALGAALKRVAKAMAERLEHTPALAPLYAMLPATMRAE